MFIKMNKRWCNRAGQQRSSGYFLLLASGSNQKDVRALVRYCRMSQCGHFMMGTIRAFTHEITVSGTYGSDGLPYMAHRLPETVWSRMVRLPEELVEAFWSGGGHNSSGSEAKAMHEWANKNFNKLSRP